jgi:DNA helicase-2/ATP-dependent DNA helicase PcrA
MTLGVLYRIEELADRPEGEKPEKSHPFFNIIPLTEILSAVLKVGPGSKKVMRHYSMLLKKLGPEFEILHTKKKENINSVGGPLLGEAISRMRQNKVVVSPGYDGEFGKIKIFNNQEREKIIGQKTLFIVPSAESPLQYKIKHKKKR